MAAPRKPSSPTPDWRAQARPADAPRRQKHVLRVLLSLAFLGLAACFVWLVWPKTYPGVQLAVLRVTGYRVVLAPVPFSSDDVAEFRASSPGQRTEILDQLQRSETLQGLGGALQGLVKSPRDVLILYVSAHGVSDGGKPYLLCSDYFFGEAPGETRSTPVALAGESDPAAHGRLSLETVLGQVGKCRAGLKLVLLDCNHIASDPRLGMAVNEFPRLLEGAVQQIDDPALWVLSCSRALEVSRVAYGEKRSRSLFSRFVAEGFRGSADTDGDGTVDLAEFYRFVRDGVADAVQQQGARDESQRPVLLRGGQGFAAELPRDFLFRVRRKSPAEPETAPPAKQEPASGEKADKGAAPRTNGPAPPTAPSGGDKSAPSGPAAKPAPSAAIEKPAPSGPPAKPAPSSPAEKPAPSGPDEKPAPPGAGGPPAPQGAPAKAEVRSLLAKAWAWRDKKRTRAAAGDWSPVDYAPPLWREYEALVLGHEMRYRLGAWGEISLADLQNLGAESPAEADQIRVRGRLAEAEARFASEGAAARLKGPAEDLRTVEEALKLKNELLFAAPYYAAWCARAAIVSPDSPVPVDDIAALVGKRLPEFILLLESLEDGSRPASGSPGIQESLKELRDRRDELEKLRARIERDGLEQQAKELLQEIQQKSEPRGAAGRIECLLATPLLAGELRMGLLDALDRVGPVPAETLKAYAPTSDAAIDQIRWDRLARQAELEVQLAKLGEDPKFAPDFDPKRLLGVRTVQDEARQWEEYRKLGGQLKGFYERLPGRIDQAVQSKDPSQARRARRLIPLVDARDAIVDARRVPATLGAQLSPIVLPTIVIPMVERLEVAVGKGSVELKRDSTWEAVPVRVSGSAGDRVRLRLEYDAGALEIKDREGKLSARPNAQEEFSLDPTGRYTLVLEVRPKDVARFSRAALGLQFETGRESASRKIELTLAPEDAVDLVIERIADSAGTRVAQPATGPALAAGAEGPARTVHCDAFPNRTTGYVFALKNLSHKERKVSVQFWPAAQRAEGGRVGAGGAGGALQPAPGARPLTPPIDVKPLTPPIEVTLPAAETPVPIPFEQSKAAEKPDKAEKKDGAGGSKPSAPKPKDAAEKTEPAKEGAQPAIDVPHGLVCVIRDAAAGVAWTRWVEFRHVKPDQYVEPRVSYDDAQGKIRVRLKPLADAQHLPLISQEQPIRVEWTTPQPAPGEFPARPKRPISELTDPAAEDELLADVVRAPNRVVPVVLAVDGYPRAFVYRVSCDRGQDVVPPRRDLRRIRIVAPQDGEAFASPLPDDAPLWVEFQVDAPYDALQRPDQRAEVWLELRDDPALSQRTRKSFGSDRQWIVRWEGTGPQGTVKIGTKVADFRAALDTFQLSDTKVDVRARLNLPGYPMTAEDARDARVSIVLDGEPPKILRFDAQSPVAQGADVPVSLRVSDLSGIGRVIFGFVKSDTAVLDEKEKLAEIPPASLADGTEFEFSVPTKEAKPELIPGQKYYLAVRVWDRVNHPSQKVVPVTVAKKAEVEAKPPETTGTIEGQVYYGREVAKNAINVIVRIEKLGREAQVTDQGTFVFRGVPPGTYTIEIKSGIIYEYVKGSTTVTVSAGKTEPAKIYAERK